MRCSHLLLVVLLTLPVVSCSSFGGRRAPGQEVDGSASLLYERLTTSQEEGDLEAAAALARELINRYPQFPLIDDVVFRAGEVALAQDRIGDAAAHFEHLAREYPLSPRRQRSILLEARAHDRLGRPARAAERLAQLLSSPVDVEVRDEAALELRAIVRTRLSPADLSTLVKEYPDSEVYQEVAFDLARREYANGDYDESYRLLAELLYRLPEGPGVPEARRLLALASERRHAPREQPSSVVDPNTIGLILPVTGQLSLYGRFFDRGVTLAVDEHNAGAARPVRVVRADSRGDPYSAVGAVRRLTQEAGAVAILGSVFTMPTVAASIEANAWRVPLLSPVVSSDQLVDIGPWVFQTRVPLTVEVTAMARLAVERLRLERFAVVAPSRGERNSLGEFFAREVERLGGEIVAKGFYEEGATDFREQLDVVRESAPDAIFAPGSIEELLLLLPQVRFYDLQVQLLGLSNWNSEKLLRLSRSELEGALFPLQAYHGKDRAGYERFKTAMEEEGVTDISPVSVAGYFGMRVLLEAIASGAAAREDVRAYLEAQLRGDAASRAAQAEALSIMVVRSGKTREFSPPEPVDPFR